MKKQINDLLLKMQAGENCKGDTANQLLDLFAVSGSFPSEDEIETASIDYREDLDKYDDEGMIIVNWYDKQDAFQAGVKWFIENYR